MGTDYSSEVNYLEVEEALCFEGIYGLPPRLHFETFPN
jgi:hypothetical protein